MAKRNLVPKSKSVSISSTRARCGLIISAMEADPDSPVRTPQSDRHRDRPRPVAWKRRSFVSRDEEKGTEELERKNLLLRVLRGLESDDLAKFKLRLRTLPDFPPSEASLEAADAKQLHGMLISRCHVCGALTVTERALREIGLPRQAYSIHFARLDFSPEKFLRWALDYLPTEQAKRFWGKLGFEDDSPEERLASYRAKGKSPREEYLKRPDFQKQGFEMPDFLSKGYKALKDIGEEELAACLRLCIEEQEALGRLKQVLHLWGETDLERFVHELRDLPVQEGIERIPNTRLQEGLSAEKLAEELFRFYGRDAALEMGAKVLKALNRESLVDQLLSLTGTDDHFPFPIILDEKQNLSDIFNPEVSEAQSSVLVRKKKIGAMENPEDFEEHFVCSRCSSQNFSERIKPDVVWDSQQKYDNYRFCPTEAGSFHCCYTDLVFEVRGPVKITYQFASWEKHRSAMDAQNLMTAGPLFNIQADPREAVAAIHFPHFLCLAGEDTSQVLIAHFVEEGIILEKPDSVGPFHAVLRNPTFSLFGVIFKWVWSRSRVNVHAIALLYQELEITVPKFHLYLLPNDPSIKKSVHECETKCPSQRILKPPGIAKPLHIGSHFFLRDLEEVKICPKEIGFQYLDADREQQFFEVYAQHMKDELVLQVIEKDEDELVWEAYIRPEELKSSTLQPQVLSPAEATPPCVGPKEHFIERHREQLISRTANVEGILDILRQNNILNEEQYQRISSRGTNQAKMRELYSLVPSWNNSCKNQLYEALKDKQRFLIDDLEGK